MSDSVKYDLNKLRWDLLPIEEVEEEVKVLTVGAQKYGPHKWKTLENAEERYFAALMRHIAAYRKGEYLDSETGLPHLAHAACNIRFLQYLGKHGEENSTFILEDLVQCHYCQGTGKVDMNSIDCVICGGSGKMRKELL